MAVKPKGKKKKEKRAANGRMRQRYRRPETRQGAWAKRVAEKHLSKADFG